MRLPTELIASVLLIMAGWPVTGAAQDAQPVRVTVHNFARAESDNYFANFAKDGAFAKFKHERELAPIDRQTVIRMNRGTLYSTVVLDLDSAPATITLPDPGNRFLAMQVINEDHYTLDVIYKPGAHLFTKDTVGTRYVVLLIRILVNPNDAADVKTVHALQDGLKVEQKDVGKFEIPNWDQTSLKKMRDSLNAVSTASGGLDSSRMFGRKDQVDPIDHLLGTAGGRGGNPRAPVLYVEIEPKQNDGLDFEVAYHDDNGRLQGKVKVCDPPKTPEWVRGKILFNTARPPMSGRRWVACSSCHPDGHHDGRAWQNPEGTRKTTALFGMAHTHPLHWSADRDEVQDFEYTIRSLLMQGRGLVSGSVKPKPGFTPPIELDETMAGRSADLDALAIYSNSFEFTLSPHAPAPGKLTPAAERGKKLFLDSAVGCATCHSGPYYADSTLQKPFKVHDVGTGGDDPRERMGPKYDTPTLLGVYRTAPYLHHGKAKTLHEVLTTYNQGDKHGKTSHLKKEELDDLVEFLKALPYEKPPDETPNTVKHRLVPKKG